MDAAITEPSPMAKAPDESRRSEDFGDDVEDDDMPIGVRD
jgi:hypothetical protein